MVGRKYCVLTGRGTAALWMAYNLVNPDRPGILLPAIICPSPMYTIQYANRKVYFADVLIEDATIDADQVEQVLNRNPEIGAVVAVHLYGHPAAMSRLSQICKSHGVLLIEDLAQALGGRDAEGRCFGSMGDVSVVSFGHTKILDFGSGGALLTDDKGLFGKAKTMAESLEPPPSELSTLSECYRKLYYTVVECSQHDRAFYKVFHLFPELFRPLYLYNIGAGQAQKIHDGLDLLEEEVVIRKNTAERYRKSLEGIPGIRFFSPSGPGVPWRFSFCVNRNIRNHLLDEVRKKGFDISSWYPSIVEWTSTCQMDDGDEFPVAESIEKEVINLWVTSEYDPTRADALSEFIGNITKKFESANWKF